MWVLFCVISAVFSTTSSYYRSYVATETEIRAHVESTVALPCKLDLKKCGQLHSVKWYKDASRVFVLSHAGLGKSEEERMDVEYKSGSVEAFLKISPVEANDEATYKCEITYLEVIENCDVVQIVKLITLKRPDTVKILTGGHKNVSLSNGTIIGPHKQGDEVDLICEATGGKPTPEVKWYHGTTEITRAEYTISRDEEGLISNASSRVQLTLSRSDLLARFECKVMNAALEEPIISWVTIDVHVRPTNITISGVNNHVNQGTNIVLTCDVFGARPAATVRWMNGSLPIRNESILHISAEDNNKQLTYATKARDGTYTTKSSLIFNTTHYEDGRTFYCYAENEVMRNNSEPELTKSLILDVRHPPVIKVSPRNKTVNESTSLTANGSSILLNCQYFANPQELIGIVWARDGKNLSLTDRTKYVGGTIINPPLYIYNITREDMGEYTCSLENNVGMETSPDTIFLNVQFPPDVEVVMEPSTPIRAIDRSNVLLECNITSGNPSTLLKVRWFLDGQLMKEFPECNYTNYDENGNGEGTGGPFCGLDPSILSLERVDETFAGNYTCQGKNVAGWGPVSEPQELIVYYPPSPARLVYSPRLVIKGAVVALNCTVDSRGRPDNVTYLWYRGTNHMLEETSSRYIIQSARLETRSNFTCVAENDGGKSDHATVFINVQAPPTFIQKLTTYQGVLYSSKNISLTCIVECYPECSIIWKKDGVPLDIDNNPLYNVETHRLPPDARKNDFESINSTLIWNMTAWPGQELDRTAPNSNYTCESMPNPIGAGVSSTIEIAVDYPPEVNVKPVLVNVIEHQTPSSVKCIGKGRPTLNYQWKKATKTDVISTKDELLLNPLTREESGMYTCEASNKHGNRSANVYFNVQYAPQCHLTHIEKDSTLLCTVEANPQEVNFAWTVKESNETFPLTSGITQEGLKSYLILDSSIDIHRTYYCSANNSVGRSKSCEINVTGILPWWKQFKQEKLIIIIASIIAIIIIVIIICIIIIMLCRRKRADTKYNNPLEMEERENPDGHCSNISDQSKWPLQPGVLIQVNKLNNVSISQLSSRVSPFKSTSVSRPSTYFKYKRNKSKVYARLERLKDLLGLSGGRHHVPIGIKESASGVVTFKKINPNVPATAPRVINSRKRKKPGYAPNPSSIEDKARLGAVPPVGGTVDPSSDPDKGFYENLPFHGMQNPPNKPYRPDPCDLVYADVDYNSYGPINYKAASIYAAMKRNKNNNKMEELNKDDLL